MTQSVVVSGPPAVGKTTVARGLAEAFGMRHLSGGDILKEMAREAGFGVGGGDWWDTESGMAFLRRREDDPSFDRKVDRRLMGMFQNGGVVITSYTLPWLVDGGIKVWLEGSHASSTARMQSRDNISSKDAYEITKTRFTKNVTLYRKMYGFEFKYDESVFDARVETDNLTIRQVVDAACGVVERLL